MRRLRYNMQICCPSMCPYSLSKFICGIFNCARAHAGMLKSVDIAQKRDNLDLVSTARLIEYTHNFIGQIAGMIKLSGVCTQNHAWKTKHSTFCFDHCCWCSSAAFHERVAISTARNCQRLHSIHTNHRNYSFTYERNFDEGCNWFHDCAHNCIYTNRHMRFYWYTLQSCTVNSGKSIGEHLCHRCFDTVKVKHKTCTARHARTHTSDRTTNRSMQKSINANLFGCLTAWITLQTMNVCFYSPLSAHINNKRDTHTSNDLS